jgi:hypothetical protein
MRDRRQDRAQRRERYGAPRIRAELRAEGQTVSRKRVEPVMRQLGIRARAPRRYRVCTTDSKHSLPVAENLLEQNFVADRPDQVWLADITYIPTGDGWLYLAVILDLFTRKVSAGPCAITCGPNSPSPRSPWQSNDDVQRQGSSVILTAAAKAESTGRRNTTGGMLRWQGDGGRIERYGTS